MLQKQALFILVWVDICVVLSFCLAIAKKASMNIIISINSILEHMYFVCILEIYPGMELLDFRVGSVLVDTAREFSEVVV